MTCRLIHTKEPECEGKIMERFVNDTHTTNSCEKHYLIYRQIKYLAECGITAELLKNSTIADRILWIKKIEEGIK